jgi:hypothetical protein
VIERGSTEGDRVIPYFVDESRYVNLDSARDFVLAEALLRTLAPVEASRP